MPHRNSLCQMAQMIRDREISSLELVESHLKQIDAVNPRINAFVSVHAEEARAGAKKADDSIAAGDLPGPLHGVPVTIKDSFDIAGLPTLCGSRFRLGHKAERDATAVGRLRAAGAVILGKTNTAEFLNNYESDNNITGRTNNPWDLARTPGGSSGGESAAIASFCSAGGIGSDGGGSIRVPAHFTGIAGLKPTPGRASAAGHFPEIAHPGGLLGVGGPMARTASDVRLLFSVLAGHDIEDPFSSPVPLRIPDLCGLKVGVWTEMFNTRFQPGIVETVERAAVTLQQIGIEANPVSPTGLDDAPDLWFIFFERLFAPMTKQLIEGREQEAHWTATELMHRALNLPALSASDVVLNLIARDRMRTRLLQQMEHNRILLTPVCGGYSFPHRTRPFDLLEMMRPVTVFNLLGMPAMVIPFGSSPEGLPIGIQLAGRPYDEELLLEVAIRLEAARGPLSGPALDWLA